MTRVIWDDLTDRLYQTGIDRGMLYTDPVIPVAVPWTGLVSITEDPDGGDAQAFYLDGRKTVNTSSGEDYKATLEAFDAPTEFAPCAGWNRMSIGLFAVDQPRQLFNFSYRTMIGSYGQGFDFGYKIHLVYNVTGQLSSFTHVSVNNSAQPKTHSWTITACPIDIPGRKASAHVIFDTRFISKTAVTRIEEVLYGTDDTDPRFLTPEEIVSMQLIEDSIFFGGVSMKKPGLSGIAEKYGRMFMKKPNLSGTGTVT